MGTTAEKGQRVLQSIAEVQEGINNIGGSLTDQTPFKNFRAELDNIYNNLPKTDYEEGSNITLENCLKGKLDYEDDKVGYGDTEQESTTGKQLFQMPSTQTLTDVTLTQNSDGSLDIVGTAGANRDFSTDFIPLSNTGLTLGGSYYLSVGTTFSGVSIQIVGYNSSNGWVATSSMQSTTQGQAITLFSDSSITKIKFILRVYSGTTINQKNIKIMLNTGNSRANFEKYTGGIPAPNPSYPFPIQVVTGEQEIIIRGKNKLKINDVTLTSNGVTLTVKDNYFILNGTNNGTESVFQLSNYITPFNTNANTKLKAFQISGTASGSLVNTFFRTYSNWGNQVNVNFTQTTIANYSNELTYNNCMLALAGGTYTDYKIGIMVADNLTSDDTFENYITPITKTLNLGNIELAEIGNYRDYILTDRSTGKWYKHSAIDKIVSYNGETISTTYMSTTGQLTTGSTVYYGKTATDTEITGTTLLEQLEDIYNIMSNNGTTIIEIAGELPMIIKCRALKGE